MLKNKQPKYNPSSPDDSWFIKTWNTPKGRAGIKLMFYGIFIIFIILIIFIKRDSTPSVYKASYKSIKLTYEEKKAKLLDNNYEFKYNITLQSGEKIKYYGYKNLNIESGYKESDNTIIKYLKENDVIYKIGLENKEEFTDLYAKINADYLNVNYIYNLINDLSFQINDKEYIYTLDNNISIVVKTNDINISKITINDNSNYYELEFSNIGKVKTEDII